MLIDRGVLRATKASRWEVASSVADVDVPRSIQGLISARLDGLPDEEKAVLQDAAVVGREFWLGAVVRLSGQTRRRDPRGARPAPHQGADRPARAVELLRRARVLVPASADPRRCVRLAAEGAPSRASTRRSREWAAERAGDRADEMALLIATHHREALRYLEELGDTGQARREAELAAYRWSRLAGDRATALWLQSDAIVWYGEALRLADQVGAPLEERLATARAHTEASFAAATTTENEAACRRYLALAEEAGDERGAGWAQAELRQDRVPRRAGSGDAGPGGGGCRPARTAG